MFWLNRANGELLIVATVVVNHEANVINVANKIDIIFKTWALMTLNGVIHARCRSKQPPTASKYQQFLVSCQ